VKKFLDQSATRIKGTKLTPNGLKVADTRGQTSICLKIITLLSLCFIHILFS
jgi:hypothetical protein